VPRTLIVDDEEDMRLLIRATIETANDGLCVAGEANDGSAALDAWRDHQPDVVVIDHRMPGMTGLEAARQILAEDPGQPIVLFSAFLNSDITTEAREIGVRVCMQKDALFDLPDVLRAVATEAPPRD